MKCIITVHAPSYTDLINMLRWLATACSFFYTDRHPLTLRFEGDAKDSTGYTATVSFTYTTHLYAWYRGYWNYKDVIKFWNNEWLHKFHAWNTNDDYWYETKAE